MGGDRVSWSMAKPKKKHDDTGDVVAEAGSETTTGLSTAVVPAAGPPERLGSSATSSAVSQGGPAHGVVAATSSVAAEVAGVVRGVLPARGSAYLAGAALLVFGVVDPPGALGGALVYEALRRWSPPPAR